jgi:hypothetical protein
VVSADGTTIGYRQLGGGPGIVVLHGSMSSGYYHLQLAEALADAFTVYLPDRRGRGLSGPYRRSDGIEQEAGDLDAVLAATAGHRDEGRPARPPAPQRPAAVAAGRHDRRHGEPDTCRRLHSLHRPRARPSARRT